MCPISPAPFAEKSKTLHVKMPIAMVTKPNLEYLYDAMGNRITKIVKPAGSTSLDWVYTHYVRDAQGNVMATYKKENINQATSYQLTERHIYGSSRVGIDNKSIELIGYTAPSDDLYRHQIGLKNYELTNHLGNVNAVITDRKIPRSTNGLNIDYYMPDIVSATDYYASGAPMPGRSFNGDKYRFGFNGKENDAESNTQDYGMRIYDTRLCRFLSVDPLKAQYPFLSVYQFGSLNPIMNIDVDGLEGQPAIQMANGNNSSAISSTYVDQTQQMVINSQIQVNQFPFIIAPTTTPQNNATIKQGGIAASSAYIQTTTNFKTLYEVSKYTPVTGQIHAAKDIGVGLYNQDYAAVGISTLAFVPWGKVAKLLRSLTSLKGAGNYGECEIFASEFIKK